MDPSSTKLVYPKRLLRNGDTRECVSTKENVSMLTNNLCLAPKKSEWRMTPGLRVKVLARLLSAYHVNPHKKQVWMNFKQTSQDLCGLFRSTTI